jgi:cupin 2 domain-containing protein
MLTNLFATIPETASEEEFKLLLASEAMRVARIVSHGHASPDEFWYDQDHDEWVTVLKGAARLRFEDRVVEMAPGDFLNIPAHQKHRVDWTTPLEPTIWLAIHYCIDR